MDRYVYDKIIVKYLVEEESDLITACFFCEYDREKDITTVYDSDGKIQELSGPYNLIFWLVTALNTDKVSGEEIDITGEGYSITRLNLSDVPECIKKYHA